MKNKHISENLFFALPLAALIIVYCAVLSPIYVWLCSDIIYIESYLPGVLEILLELCQLLIWVILFSNMIKAVKVRRKVFFITITLIFLLTRYFYPIIIDLIKGFALAPMNIMDSLLYFVADILILTIAFVSISIIKDKTEIKYIHFSALISAILLSVSKIVSRIIFDIFYGAPESVSEVLIMSAYYFFDIIYGVISYLLIGLISKILLTKKNSN